MVQSRNCFCIVVEDVRHGFNDTADGSTIVGTYWGGDAAIWDKQNGARRLADALSDDYGLSLSGWNLESAVDISADGNTIIGHGEYHGEHWVVVVPEPAARVIMLGMIFGLGACRHQGMSRLSHVDGSDSALLCLVDVGKLRTLD